MKGDGLRILFAANDGGNLLGHRRPLLEAVLRSGAEVHAAVPPGPADAALAGLGVRMHAWRLSRRGLRPDREWASLRSLEALDRSIRPDLAQHATLKPVLYGGIAARRAGVPAACHLVTGLGFSFVSGGWKARAARAGIAVLARRAFRHPNQAVLFQNADDHALFVRRGWVGEEEAHVVPGSGVDTEAFRPSPEPDGPPLVVLPARLLRSKGVLEFAEAARLLARDGVAARFALVGAPDPGNPDSITEKEVRQVAMEGPLEWWGHRPDMAQVLAQAAIVCLPSRREGVPKALLEAAACGRPLVATDVPGCRDIVLPGRTGLLVPPDDPAALADAIGRLVADPRERRRMGQEARRLAVAKFSTQQVIGQTLAIYRRLLGQ